MSEDLTTAEPLRIGILGAARITELALVSPAHATGHRLVAVAARDRSRAETFARDHGVERVHDTYDDLIADPEVDLVYNPLANALHAPWNVAALRAGKHVLTEKPSASNLEEALLVQAVVAESPGSLVEGFHYWFHPVFQRVRSLVADGAVGEVRHTEVSLTMPAPGPGDPRWSLDLAGGSVMDLGCYSLHASRMLGALLGGEPTVLEARATEHPDHPGVDARMEVELGYPDGVTGRADSDMGGSAVDFHCRVVGSRGEILAPGFVLPHQVDTVVLTTPTSSTTEHLGTRSSYTYQLEAVADHVRRGTPIVPDADDAVATMRLIDAAYVAAGLPVRPGSSS